MSIEAMAYVKTLTITKPAQKLVMLLIADRISNETGECFPGQKRLAKEASMTERYVRRILGDLVKSGLLSSRYRYGENGKRTTSAYELVGFLGWLGCAETCSADQRQHSSSSEKSLQEQSGRTRGTIGSSLQEQECRTRTQRRTQREPKESGKLDLPEVPEVEKPESHIDQALAMYEQVAVELGLPKVRKLNDQRKASMRLRLKEHGLDGWAEAMQALRDSSHCQGENNRGWRANLDFVLQESSMLKLLEGVYADKKKVAENKTIPDDTLVKYCVEYEKNPDFWSPKLEAKVGPPPDKPGCRIKQWIIDKAREVWRAEKTGQDMAYA